MIKNINKGKNMSNKLLTMILFAKYEEKIPSFFLSKYLVTFEEFDLFCKNKKIDLPNDSGFKREKHPVINISYFEAALFCNYMSKKHNLEECYDENFKLDLRKKGFRMPMKYEYEYACYNGNYEKIFIWEDKKPNENLLNFNNHVKKTTDVGKYPEYNMLFDLSGNVWEYCNDTHENRDILDKESYVISKGGSYKSDDYQVAIESRLFVSPYGKYDDIGFRLAMSL
jgi:formylglycine-generating enzyme required for sulfatase activity